MSLLPPDEWQSWPVAPLLVNAGLRGDLDVRQLGQQIVDALRGTTWPMAARAVWIDPTPDEKQTAIAFAKNTGQRPDSDIALYLLRLHVAPLAPGVRDITADDARIEAFDAIRTQITELHGELVNLSALPCPADDVFERAWTIGEHHFATGQRSAPTA